MANPIFFNPNRALTANITAAPGALAHPYIGGTTTPLTLYADEDETTPLPWPIVANAAGIFPQPFSSEPSIKIVVTTADGETLYTIDPILASGVITGDQPFANQAALEAAAIPSVVYEVKFRHLRNVFTCVRDASGAVTSADGAKWRIVNRPIVGLCIGQSNMVGYVDATGGDQDKFGALAVWNNSGLTGLANGTQFDVAEFGQKPFNNSPDGGLTWSNSMAFHCGKRISENLQRPVYLIVIARSAHNLESWMTDATLTANSWTRTNYNLNQFIVDNIGPALAQVPGSPSAVDYVQVHQGEANSGDGPALYLRKWSALLSDLFAIPQITRDAIMMVGELARSASDVAWFDGHRNAIRYLSLGRSTQVFTGIRCVTSEGIPTVSDGNVHFSGAGLARFGARYADAFLTPQQASREFHFENTDYSVNGGLDWFTLGIGDRAFTAYGSRRPVSSLDMTTGQDPDMGRCYTNGEDESRIMAHRRVARIRRGQYVNISYEVKANTPASMPHRSFVWCYDEDGVFLSSVSRTPTTSPIVGGAGRIIETHSISFAELPAGTAQVSPGVWIGDTSSSGPGKFNFISVGISDVAENPLGPDITAITSNVITVTHPYHVLANGATAWTVDNVNMDALPLGRMVTLHKDSTASVTFVHNSTGGLGGGDILCNINRVLDAVGDTIAFTDSGLHRRLVSFSNNN